MLSIFINIVVRATYPILTSKTSIKRTIQFKLKITCSVVELVLLTQVVYFLGVHGLIVEINYSEHIT